MGNCAALDGISRWMKSVHALPLLATLLAVSAACHAPVAEAPAPDYRPGEAGTVDHALCLLGFTAIPLEEAQTTGHHVVSATVNGRKGVFILDTGANVSVIDVDHAALFGLGNQPPARKRAMVIGGGAAAARQVRIESLSLGPVAVRQRTIVLTDLGPLGDAMAPLVGGAVHGLIGQDVLKEHRAVIDVKRPILYLIERDRDPAPVPAERCRGEAEPKA